DWDAFQRAVSMSDLNLTGIGGLRARFRNQSVRLAGPVFGSTARPTTLTLLAEHRTQRTPSHTESDLTVYEGTSTSELINTNGQMTDTTSYYAEARSRLFDEVTRVPFLRGLEIQLAVRHDQEKDTFSATSRDPEAPLVRAKFSATAYT